MSELPSKPGFYWWRETEVFPWRVVQLIDFGKGRIMSYDVQKHAWSGRPMTDWVLCAPIGEWVEINEPEK